MRTENKQTDLGRINLDSRVFQAVKLFVNNFLEKKRLKDLGTSDELVTQHSRELFSKEGGQSNYVG